MLTLLGRLEQERRINGRRRTGKSTAGRSALLIMGFVALAATLTPIMPAALGVALILFLAGVFFFFIPPLMGSLF